jgi:hypothetical protein
MTSRGDVKSRRSHVVFPYLVAPAEALVSFDVFLSSVIFRTPRRDGADALLALVACVVLLSSVVV